MQSNFETYFAHLKTLESFDRDSTHKEILRSKFSQDQIVELFQYVYTKYTSFNDELYITIAKKKHYNLLKWMERIEPENFPGYVVNVIEDISVIEYFLKLDYEPNEWAIPNATEFDNCDERIDLFLDYEITLDDEAFQWLAIDDFQESHIPIIHKMAAKRPEWLNSEHGWVFTYRVMHPEEGSIEHLNKILMTSWEDYDYYDSDDEDEIANDSNYQELDEFLERVKPNANTIYICGKNSSLSYIVIKKIFEKAEFTTCQMMSALSVFKEDITENIAMISKSQLSNLFKIAKSRKSKVFRKLDYPELKKSKLN